MTRRLSAALALLILGGATWLAMRHQLLNALLFFPSRVLDLTPEAAGLPYVDVDFETEDGEQLHGWWIPSPTAPSVGHVLLFHGNAGSISGRVLHARLLADAGLDSFLFDYRGYGRSSGSPSEQGTYSDARAARAAVLRQPGVDGNRLFFLGESLGGAVALALALEAPPAGLVLQSTFTSVRDMGRLHYPILPGGLVPDAYPSLRRIPGLRAPLLVLHGDRDEIVPLAQGQALHDAAPQPKSMRVFQGVGHNDLVPVAGVAYAEAIASWARELVEGGTP
jgi:fermentation-respiration switch protein FrsA (DUF1100 family)